MLLSDAIVLGSTMGLKVDNSSWNSCLIGIGINAIGKTNLNNIEAEARYPWLRNVFNSPFKQWSALEARSIITHFATLIHVNQSTLEEAVAWIRSVEPREEPCPETVQTETTDLAQAVA